MLIGDAQFFLAGGEPPCHVVESFGQRLEFGEPGLVAGARFEVAAAEARSGARQRPDRPHDEPLAAEPYAHQHQHAEQRELQIGDTDFAVDAAVHDAFVEADRKPRIGPRHAHEREQTRQSVEARGRRGAFIALLHGADERLAGEVATDQVSSRLPKRR